MILEMGSIVGGAENTGGGIDMRIKKIITQIRRDFVAIYQCEHCGHEERGSGYDDDNFHRNVIPNMTCGSCGLKAGDDYRPMGTKYSADAVV
jgi:transcription elongation factor Elf1